MTRTNKTSNGSRMPGRIVLGLPFTLAVTGCLDPGPAVGEGSMINSRGSMINSGSSTIVVLHRPRSWGAGTGSLDPIGIILTASVQAMSVIRLQTRLVQQLRDLQNGAAKGCSSTCMADVGRPILCAAALLIVRSSPLFFGCVFLCVC